MSYTKKFPTVELGPRTSNPNGVDTQPIIQIEAYCNPYMRQFVCFASQCERQFYTRLDGSETVGIGFEIFSSPRIQVIPPVAYLRKSQKAFDFFCTNVTQEKIDQAVEAVKAKLAEKAAT